MPRRIAIGLSLALLAAVVALLVSPAFAYHDGAHNGGAATGGSSFDAIWPIIIVVTLVMGGIGFWGQKKSKTKSKRKKRRQGR